MKVKYLPKPKTIKAKDTKQAKAKAKVPKDIKARHFAKEKAKALAVFLSA